MKIKTKSNFNVSASNLNASNKKQLKRNKKANPKHSPEENLGLKLEKLIEKGVKVRKIENETPEKNKESPKFSPATKAISIGPGKGLKRPVNGNGFANFEREKTSEVLRKGKTTPKVKNKNARSSVSNGKTNEEKKSEPCRLELHKVIKAVQACLDNAKAKEQNNKLISEPEQLYLQLTVIKKGITAQHTCRFNLPHKLVTENSEVCMIIRDEKGKNAKDADSTIEEYKELLQNHGINNVKKIITYDQLRKEYSRHELRRKLCNAYDFFIADSKLAKVLLQHLGKHFIVTRKIPILITIDKNLKSHVEKAFHKTPMKITSNQDMFACVVGNGDFSAKMIAENISSVVDALKPDIFPGGWENIRSVSVKFQRGAKFPIYYSNVSPNSIEQPVMEPRRSKSAVPVVDELSTLPDALVRVDPDGTVTVLRNTSAAKNKKQNISVEEEDDDDEEEEEGEGQSDDDTSDFDISDDEPATKKLSPSLTQNKKQLVKKSVIKNDDDDDDDDDDDGDEDKEDESEDDDESDDSEEVIANEVEQDYLRRMKELMSSGDIDNEEDEDDSDDDDDEDDDEGEDDSDDDEDEGIGKKLLIKKQLQSLKERQNSIGNNKNGSNVVSKPQEEDDDDDDDEDEDDDSDEEEESDSDEDATLTPNSKKRKLVENSTSLFKKNKPDNIVEKELNKSVLSNKNRAKFDTTLGESWVIKKKQQPIQTATNQQDGKKKKNNSKKAHKFNKHQRKANIKMNKAKKNKSH